MSRIRMTGDGPKCRCGKPAVWNGRCGMADGVAFCTTLAVSGLAPAFILGTITVTVGTARRFTLHIWHNREAFKPTRLYAHLPEGGAFIVENVQWGLSPDKLIFAPIDLYEFGMAHQGVELELPKLARGEEVTMVVQYTGRVLQGLNNGSQYSLPIIWAEPGASLLKSANCTLTYSVE